MPWVCTQTGISRAKYHNYLIFDMLGHLPVCVQCKEYLHFCKGYTPCITFV